MDEFADLKAARGEVVAERQAWYEQQIALAEDQWAATFLYRWERGDDVPSKEHYVALWLAERAAPPPVAAQQPPDEGEEIMVNTPYDVFTLPLRPSGLSSGPRFVVHVPGPEQSTAVDESMVERACRHWYTQWDKADLATKRLWAKTMSDLLTAALTGESNG